METMNNNNAAAAVVMKCSDFLEKAFSESLCERNPDDDNRFIIELFRDRGDDDIPAESVRGWTLAKKNIKPHEGQVWENFNAEMESMYSTDYYYAEKYKELVNWLGEMALQGTPTDAETFDFSEWWSENVDFSFPTEDYLSDVYTVYWKEAVTVREYLENHGLTWDGYQKAKEMQDRFGGASLGNPVYNALSGYDLEPSPECGWDGMTPDSMLDLAATMTLHDIADMYDAYIAGKSYKIRFDSLTAVGWDADSDWREFPMNLGKSVVMEFKDKVEWDIMTDRYADDYDGTATFQEPERTENAESAETLKAA